MMGMPIRSAQKRSIEPTGSSSSPLSSFFDDFFNPMLRWPFNLASGQMVPQTDIYEKKDAFIVKMDLPGVKKENIDISLSENMLTIKAESRFEETEKDTEGDVIRQERREGQYVRSFSLGSEVNEENIQAEFTDGVLKLRIPKKEGAETTTQAKKVTIA